MLTANSEAIEFIDPPLVIIPNVFSPNNDGINDEFLILCEEQIDLKCIILNRWGGGGQELYSFNQSWDGKTNSSQEVLQGVYFYIVEYPDQAGALIMMKGTIQLLK